MRGRERKKECATFEKSADDRSFRRSDRFSARESGNSGEKEPGAKSASDRNEAGYGGNTRRRGGMSGRATFQVRNVRSRGMGAEKKGLGCAKEEKMGEETGKEPDDHPFGNLLSPLSGTRERRKEETTRDRKGEENATSAFPTERGKIWYLERGGGGGHPKTET